MPSARLPLPARGAAVLAPAVLAASAALLGGCGADSPSGELTVPSGEATFPLELRVSGGQTVRDDRLVVQADGTASGKVRLTASGTGPAAPVTCRVEATFLGELARAASADLRPGATSPVPTSAADLETVGVVGPGGAAYDVGEGGSRVTTLAARLVTDVTQPPAQRTLCR